MSRGEVKGVQLYFFSFRYRFDFFFGGFFQIPHLLYNFFFFFFIKKKFDMAWCFIRFLFSSSLPFELIVHLYISSIF